MPVSMHMTLEFRCRMKSRSLRYRSGILWRALGKPADTGTSLLDDRQKDTGVKILRRRHGILDLANARIEVCYLLQPFGNRAVAVQAPPYRRGKYAHRSELLPHVPLGN